jgi:uncharacterized protein (TIGR00251 family)
MTMGEAVAVLRLQIHLQPRAARTRIAGRHGAAIKVQVHAAPVDGAANAALLDLLAETLAVPRHALHIVRGVRSREKVVEVYAADLGACRRRLDDALQPRVDKGEVAG